MGNAQTQAVGRLNLKGALRVQLKPKWLEPKWLQQILFKKQA